MHMRLKRLELNGFKSFAKKSVFSFTEPITAIVGPNGSGKSNVVEAIRFVLGEQSMKSLRGKTGSDLIFQGSHAVPALSRASVEIHFANNDRTFRLHGSEGRAIPLDFDEVRIRRELYRDGKNRYFVNGVGVRMRDVHDLISSLNIGASGHHIISQGEADRYLNANPRERRQLIEEALGLRTYQYRIRESQRKLERAEENLRELEMLRREIHPQLRFLRKQAEKIRELAGLRKEFSALFSQFRFWEDFRIRESIKVVEGKRETARRQIGELREKLRASKQEGVPQFQELEEKVREKEQFIASWQEKIRENELERGKIEGMVSVLRGRGEEAKEKVEHQVERKLFTREELDSLFKNILSGVEKLIREGALSHILPYLQESFRSFLSSHSTEKEGPKSFNEQGGGRGEDVKIRELERKRNVLLDATEEAKGYIHELQKEREELLRTIEEEKQRFFRTREERFRQEAELRTLQQEVQRWEEKLRSLQEEERWLARETQEVHHLVSGEGVREIGGGEISDLQEFLNLRPQLLRSLERMKIRIEDFAIGEEESREILGELARLEEREENLETEISDIKESIHDLRELIHDLRKTLRERFRTGIEEINHAFRHFFRLMFGGGDAKLILVPLVRRGEEGKEEGEEKERELGVEIEVQIPKKRVSSLDMLSGGERSLSSITLLFALSQVNPPPFLILDETDAALDEENSRRYGDMIEALAEKSQLILVTHNRETMSRAHVLFGITLHPKGYSIPLSLKLDQAIEYAK